METGLFYATAAGFVILSVAAYAWLLAELKKALAKTAWDDTRKNRIYNRVLVALVGWTFVVSVLALTGVLSDFSSFPPKIIIVLVVPLIAILTATFSKAAKDLLPLIPAKNIVRLQTFRVFVEILLWLMVLQHVTPIQMSFEGRNFDVLTGLTAPLAAYLLINNKTALIVWNIFGLALLANILTIAILSFPTPFRVFMNEPANTLVAVFPFVLLPALLVPLAYGLHFMSLRQLALRRHENPIQA